MLDLFFIILIFLEILGLYFAILKIVELDKKIQQMNTTVIEYGKIINEMHTKIQKAIHKINWFVSILTNKKLWQIKKIITVFISIIEVVIVLKSFNFQRGFGIHIKNVKKLLYTGLSKQFIKRLLNGTILFC